MDKPNTPMGLSRQPRKGERVAWRDRKGNLYSHATVLRIEGNLCWIKPDDGSDSAPFIWRFPRDGTLNNQAEIIGCEVTPTAPKESEIAT
jgi:hypothetical protein